MTARRAVFLDRDGVLNPLIYHRDVGIIDSPFTLNQFRIFPRVPQAIRRLNELEFAVIVVSNQPGIAKGHFSMKTLREFNAKLLASLRPARARIDAIYYCLHHPDATIRRFRKRCECRKPRAGMLIRAADELGISLSESYMVGDGLTDVEAGNRAGCRTVFIGRWKCECCQFIRPHNLHPTYVARDLPQAVRQIIDDAFARTK